MKNDAMNKFRNFCLLVISPFCCSLCNADALISANIQLSVELHEPITANSEPNQILESEIILSECTHLLQPETELPETESKPCQSGTKLVSVEHEADQILLTVEPI